MYLDTVVTQQISYSFGVLCVGTFMFYSHIIWKVEGRKSKKDKGGSIDKELKMKAWAENATYFTQDVVCMYVLASSLAASERHNP